MEEYDPDAIYSLYNQENTKSAYNTEPKYDDAYFVDFAHVQETPDGSELMLKKDAQFYAFLKPKLVENISYTKKTKYWTKAYDYIENKNVNIFLTGFTEELPTFKDEYLKEGHIRSFLQRESRLIHKDMQNNRNTMTVDNSYYSESYDLTYLLDLEKQIELVLAEENEYNNLPIADKSAVREFNATNFYRKFGALTSFDHFKLKNIYLLVEDTSDISHALSSIKYIENYIKESGGKMSNFHTWFISKMAIYKYRRYSESTKYDPNEIDTKNLNAYIDAFEAKHTSKSDKDQFNSASYLIGIGALSLYTTYPDLKSTHNLYLTHKEAENFSWLHELDKAYKIAMGTLADSWKFNLACFGISNIYDVFVGKQGSATSAILRMLWTRRRPGNNQQTLTAVEMIKYTGQVFIDRIANFVFMRETSWRWDERTAGITNRWNTLTAQFPNLMDGLLRKFFFASKESVLLISNFIISAFVQVFRTVGEKKAYFFWKALNDYVKDTEITGKYPVRYGEKKAEEDLDEKQLRYFWQRVLDAIMMTAFAERTMLGNVKYNALLPFLKFLNVNINDGMIQPYYEDVWGLQRARTATFNFANALARAENTNSYEKKLRMYQLTVYSMFSLISYLCQPKSGMTTGQKKLIQHAEESQYKSEGMQKYLKRGRLGKYVSDSMWTQVVLHNWKLTFNPDTCFPIVAYLQQRHGTSTMFEFSGSDSVNGMKILNFCFLMDLTINFPTIKTFFGSDIGDYITKQKERTVLRGYNDNMLGMVVQYAGNYLKYLEEKERNPELAAHRILRMLKDKINNNLTETTEYRNFLKTNDCSFLTDEHQEMCMNLQRDLDNTQKAVNAKKNQNNMLSQIFKKIQPKWLLDPQVLHVLHSMEPGVVNFINKKLEETRNNQK
jgi:hypothetical protein